MILAERALSKPPAIMVIWGFFCQFIWSQAISLSCGV
jgi:hypothetical protein